MVRVFIVDDSQLFVEELVQTTPWEALGCEVCGTANDADTAEKQIRKLVPGIVISDICMANRSGLDLIDALSDMPDMEYILISAYSRFEYAQKAIRLDVADYFVKPFDDEEFYEAVRRLVEKIRTRDQEKVTPVPMNPDDPKDYLNQAIQYIDQLYAEEISVATVAGACFISESYLSKLFRKKLDTSFNEYLNYIRIQKAQHLLRNTNLMIYEIAEKTGFNTEKYFSLVFRKVTGITPRQYKTGSREDSI